jgi:hypothetical protein
VEAVTIEVPPPRAEESRLERLSRLLNILKMNVKPTMTNIDKALLTITKIDVLDLSVEELKESGIGMNMLMYVIICVYRDIYLDECIHACVNV